MKSICSIKVERFWIVVSGKWTRTESFQRAERKREQMCQIARKVAREACGNYGSENSNIKFIK